MQQRTRVVAGITAIALAGVVAGCGTGTAKSPATGKASTTAGRVYVAYAGSLQQLNSKEIGPGFHKATGAQYRGQGGGSYGMAHLVATGSIQANVFESIGTGPLKDLGRRVPWAVGMASSPLVIAYSPASPYAKTFAAIKSGKLPLKNLFELMAQPGFHLGRTNPATDPQGQAFVMMVHGAQSLYKLPVGTAEKILGTLENPQQIFAEEAILSRLQAGQLDAASAFLSEAIQLHLDYIALPNAINFGDPADQAQYAQLRLNLGAGKTVTGSTLEIYAAPLAGSFDAKTANAFVQYLLSPAGLKILKSQGYQLTTSVVMGSRSSIPSRIRQELKR